MRYNDLLIESTVLNEFGKHGHPGYGQGIFRQAYYQFLAHDLVDLRDQHVREFITHWLADILAKDSPKFKADLFVKAVESGKRFPSAKAVFQQRHFYYLAGEISKIGDLHAREFVANFFADIAGKTNPNFNRARWYKFCGVQDA